MIKDPETSVKAVANLALGKSLPPPTCWSERHVWGQALREAARTFWGSLQRNPTKMVRIGEGNLFSSGCDSNIPVAVTETSDTVGQ